MAEEVYVSLRSVDEETQLNSNSKTLVDASSTSQSNGNGSIGNAVNFVVEHPSNPDIDQMPTAMMGKKARKKARASQKDKRATSAGLKVENDSNTGVVDDGGLLKERKVCVHLQKIDLVKVCSSIESRDTGCEDCREGAVDRRGGRGKGKHGKKKGKKKGGGSDSKAESKATWICLQCGHFACGGVGLPTTPQSHAVRHARQNKHPLVIQLENPQLKWCFSCGTFISDEKSEYTGEQKDVFSDIIKLLKKQSSKGSSVDVEDIWFGGGSAIGSVSESKAESKEVSVVNGKDMHVVKGLVNLGNTCFFNSVMQNLLAMDILRERILKCDGFAGPLTSSLKKIILETSVEVGQKNVINPKALFGCVCSKAPQFRGYQQQDSHELLRYLLDGLSAEDSRAKKSDNSSSETQRSLVVSSTFVDEIFGGRLSSTVCCVECGHSSVVYEPFLDLSLPVPTKKPPPKKAPPTYRAKKTKLPPKIVGRSSTLKKEENRSPVVSGCDPSPANKTSCGSKDAILDCPPSAKSDESCNVVDINGSVSQSYCNSTESDNTSTKVMQSDAQDVDSLAWLDYLEPASHNVPQDCDDMTGLDNLETVQLLEDPNLASDKKDPPVSVDSGSKYGNGNIEQDKEKAIGETSLHSGTLDINAESTVDVLADEPLAQVQDNQVLLLPYKEDCSTKAEISLTAAASGEDSLGFDGLGDLFNEPEVDMATSLAANNPQASNQVGNGFLTGNISESDPDEVDNTDSPVTVESCLTHFIKPELLSGEHAWHCENCSKLAANKKIWKKNLSNDEFSSSEIMQLRNHTFPDCFSTDMTSHTNGSCEPDENMKNVDTKKTNGHSSISKDKGKSSEPKKACSDGPSGSACFGYSDEGSSVGDVTASQCGVDNNFSHKRITGFSKERESEEDDEEVNSKSFKVMRDATKRILIDKAPPMMTIHLKRFGQDARGRLSKLNGYIGFDEYLDLGPYLDQRCKCPEKEDCDIYRLVGIVEHSGSMRGGHYVAYVRGRSRKRLEDKDGNTKCVWYYASDAHVREATLDEVLRGEAYLLFYEKVGP